MSYDSLVKKVGEVYHCAAEVNSLKSYEQLYDVNVKGALELWKLSIKSGSLLNYASTLSVFVSSS